MTTGHVLVLGPHGVVGAGITARLVNDPEWRLTTAARRPAPTSSAHEHLRVDLLDAASTRAAFAGLGGVTHLVHAAYVERATAAATVAPNVALLTHALDALDAAGARLDRVVLIGGGKSYGEHLGPYRTPAKESDPRVLAPVLYHDQEDLLVTRGAGAPGRPGFTWTVLRPDIVIGPSTGSPMNLLTTIAVLGALSRHAGVPLRFPGTAAAWSALHQVTDTELLADAVAWALTSAAAANEVVNVTNGDLFRWQHLWPDIAEALGVEAGSPSPMALVEQLAGAGPAWDAVVAAHGLVPHRLDELASWAFADGVWSSGYDLVQSTTKIRRAGFAGTIDSHESVTSHLRRLRAARVVP